MGKEDLKVEGEREKVIKPKEFQNYFSSSLQIFGDAIYREQYLQTSVKKHMLGDASINANFTGKPIILLKNGCNHGSISLQ